MLFSGNHVITLNNSGSHRNSPTSLLQDSNDSIEMFLEDYFCGILDQTELETRINQIIGDLVHCMEDFLSRLVSKQDLEDKELSGKSLDWRTWTLKKDGPLNSFPRIGNTLGDNRSVENHWCFSSRSWHQCECLAASKEAIKWEDFETWNVSSYSYCTIVRDRKKPFGRRVRLFWYSL